MKITGNFTKFIHFPRHLFYSKSPAFRRQAVLAIENSDGVIQVCPTSCFKIAIKYRQKAFPLPFLMLSAPFHVDR